MEIFGQEISRDQMPSYMDFKQNPSHLYQLKQERLQNLLTAQPVQMQQPTIQNTNVQQSERWNNGQN